MNDPNLDAKVEALLQQLMEMVHATPNAERLEMVEGLLVSADQLIERNDGPLIRRLQEFRDALQPRVSMEELRTFTRPISLIAQLQTFDPTTFELEPPGGGVLRLGGLCSKNGPFEAILDRMTYRDREIVTTVDPAIYNTAFPFVPLDIGTISRITPLVVTARSWGTPAVPPFLHLTFFGAPEDQDTETPS